MPNDEAEQLYDTAMRKMRSPESNTSEIVSILREAIAGGSANAAYALATWYLHGKDAIVPQDYSEAVKLLQFAAQSHHPEALYDLGVCFSNGEGVKKDKYKAFELYLEAALHGDSGAVFKVGRSYFYGDGVVKDERVAEIWLDRAHELGTYESEPGTE